MFLKVRIEDEQFKVSIGAGLNDWVWLAHHASRVYSKTIYPQGTYLPTLLYLQNIHKQLQYHPHPRQKIARYLQAYALNLNQLQCVVKIKKPNHSYSQFQKKWQKRAFQKDQYFITFNFTYLATNINRKKDFILKVKTQYNMADQMKHLFHQKQYPSDIKTVLNQRQIGPTQSKFQGTLQVPMGGTSHKLFYYERENGADDYIQTQISQKKMKKDDFIVTEEPLYIPRHQILSIIQTKMKIEDDINKTLQQKQLQTKKRNASSSLCCFTFEQLWDTLTKQYKEQLSLQEYQKSTIQKIKLCIQNSLNDLYEIFFYYFILENQQKDKKQELGIVYQDIMHFLRDYGVLVELQNLTNFLQYYNVDQTKYKSIEHTLDLKDHSIKFPQFVVILLRSIQFVQTSTFLMKGQTFDSAATKIFQKVIQIDSQLGQLSSFKRNLRQNPKIISFIRSNSQKLKQIYIWMCKKSIQSSSSCMTIMKQQLKQLLIAFHLVENNVDKVINECYKQLRLNEEGIFYYQYLTVIEWLAMATIADEKQDQIENEEQESLLIVQKMKYFLQKINIQ